MLFFEDRRSVVVVGRTRRQPPDGGGRQRGETAVTANEETQKIWIVEDWFDMIPGKVLGYFRDPAKARACFDTEAGSKFCAKHRAIAGRLTEHESGATLYGDEKGWHALRLYSATFSD